MTRRRRTAQLLNLASMLLAVIALLLGIWTEDGRWGLTGALFAVVGIPGFALFLVDDVGMA